MADSVLPSDAESEVIGQAELRELDWEELTAKLSAMRELRDALRENAERIIEGHSGEFGAAASRYLRAKEKAEHTVNLVALEQSKVSHSITNERQTGRPVSGDSRDFYD